jgi:hypothetical protein
MSRRVAQIVLTVAAALVVHCRARLEPAQPANDPPRSRVAAENAVPASEPAPAPTPVSMEESSATIEVAVAEPVSTPTAEPVALTAPPRPADDPARCLTLDASPAAVSAWGSTGGAVQLSVRARNACATGFPGGSTAFRAVAVSMEGTELGSAIGRFGAGIRPYATAETVVGIEVDVTRVRAWRVELR